MLQKDIENNIRNQLNILHPDGKPFEVRLIDVGNNKSQLLGNKWISGSVTGYYDNIELATQAIISAEKEVFPRIIAVSLNSCPPDLLARANNRFSPGCPALKNSDIVEMDNMLIDFDTVRPSGVSATNEEKALAFQQVQLFYSDMVSSGMPQPLICDSGNGYHAIIKVQGLNSLDGTKIIKETTNIIANNYSTEAVKVDTTVASPAHLVRVMGTMNRKGDSMPDRPHRRSFIIQVPDVVSPVPKERLVAIIEHHQCQKAAESNATKYPSSVSLGNQRAKFNLAKYLAHYGIAVTEVKQHGSSTLYVLEKCLFDPSHGKNEACIVQREDGTSLYQCFHNSCRSYRWSDAKRIIGGNDSLSPFMEGGNPNIEPLVDAVVSMLEVLNHPFPRTVPLIENVVSVGGATVIYGSGGVGKSNLTMNLALALASPLVTSFLDLNVKPQGRVMIIQAENAAADTKDRLALISQDPAFQAGLQEVFSPTHGLSDIRILDGDLNHDPFFERIIEDCMTLGIELLIIDPLISFHRGDENDNSSMRRTLDRLTTIMSITGVSIILVHHVGKDVRSASSSFSGRGASAIGDWAHNTFLLQVSDPKTETLELKCQKARNFKKPESIYIRLNSNLIFERIYPKATKKPNLQVIVTNAMQKLNGKASSQTDLINAIIACSPNMAKSKARSIIKGAVVDGLIQETQNQRNQEYLLIAN